MNEHQDETNPTPVAATPPVPDEAAGASPLPRHRAGMKRTWRWVLGAVSIAAVGAGVIFISKRGFRKPDSP